MKSRRNRCKRQGFGRFNRLSQLRVRQNHPNSYAARIDNIIRGWRNHYYRGVIDTESSVYVPSSSVYDIWKFISPAHFRNKMRYDKDYI